MKKFTVLLLAGAALSSCNPAMQAYKKGVKHFDAGEYSLAIPQFDKAGTKSSVDAAKLNFYEAEAYRLSNRPAEAAPYYEKALNAGSTEPDLRFRYAYALKAQGRYADALAQLQQYVQAKPASRVNLDKARREVETLRAIDNLVRKQTEYTLRPLSGLNTAGAEFAPAIAGEQLVYTASRKQTLYKNNGQPMLGLYSLKLDREKPAQATASASNAQLFATNVFRGDANEGTPTFSKDGKTMVFARGNTGKRKGGADVDLYVSRQDAAGAWGDPVKLPISDSAAWDGSPAFSADGRTLYFSSNRAGGAGGLDLFRTNVDASGRFSRPVNMGRDINTPGDEIFPYVAADGKLYFSSDGHPGLGRLDVFVATRAQGLIRVENMGQPINSPADDFGLMFYDADRGFMASNRAGGAGDDDIYYVEVASKTTGDSTTIAKNEPRKKVRYFLDGTVSTNETPVTPLDSARVRLLDDAGQPVAEGVTGQPGTFGRFPLQEGKDYNIVVERPGYLTRREPFTMQGRSIPDFFLTKPETDTTFSVAVLLDRITLNRSFVLENIYYDLDKFNIRSDAAVELDKLVTILKDNPTLKIELSSHTDVRAPDAYNLRLSQNRAKAAVDYIVSQGIAADRLTARGYGETQLVVRNARTEEEHQRNRRTEFKILSF